MSQHDPIPHQVNPDNPAALFVDFSSKYMYCKFQRDLVIICPSEAAGGCLLSRQVLPVLPAFAVSTVEVSLHFFFFTNIPSKVEGACKDYESLMLVDGCRKDVATRSSSKLGFL